jgi:hypothetical protein
MVMDGRRAAQPLLDIFSMTASEPDLQFLARQNERIINDLAHMRDSLDVLMAMVFRLETSITTVITELRAMLSSKMTSNALEVLTFSGYFRLDRPGILPYI